MVETDLKIRSRLTEIDLLRFLAAFLVVLFHYTFLGTVLGDSSSMGIPVLAPFFKYGYFGVHLFFMISGFVILMTALAKSPRQFVVSRITRLYPAFWFCCTLTFLAILLTGDKHYTVSLKDYLMNMTMLNGFFNKKYVDGVYWTLNIEIRFYFLMFLVIIFRQLRRVQYLLAAWLIVSLLLWVYPVRSLHLMFLPRYSAYFIGGAVCYLIHKEGNSFYKTALFISSYIFALSCVFEDMLMIETRFATLYDYGVIAILISMFFLVFYMIATGHTRWIQSEKWLTLGILTYPLYLIHQNMGFMLFRQLHEFMNPMALIILIAAGMLMTAYLIHQQVEKPLARFLKAQMDRFLSKSVLRQKETFLDDPRVLK